MSFNAVTGRDRYFAARERELESLLDPATGVVDERLARVIPCPLCRGDDHAQLFVKRGFTIVRCRDCRLVFANPQVDESLVLDEYREGGSNDLWVDVLTSGPQLELDREKFGEILDELEPFRGDGRLLDVGTSIGLFLRLAVDRGWDGVGTEFGIRARAYAQETLGVDVSARRIEEIDGPYDVVTILSVLEHVNDPRAMLREARRLLVPRGALYLIVPNVESLACRVLHERAATFDGRNHLVYFSASTLRDMLDREGFDVVGSRTRVAALTPVLEWLAYEEPFSDAPLEQDALAAYVDANRGDLDNALEELGLGYKLHCLARARG